MPGEQRRYPGIVKISHPRQHEIMGRIVVFIILHAHTHIHVHFLYIYTHTLKRVKSRLNKTENPQKEL